MNLGDTLKDRIFVQGRKPLVWFFQDTSGSCCFGQTFFNEATSLSDRFDVKFHGFDTEVYQIVPEKRELRGSGMSGTSFSCIEDYIQKQGIYPDAVVVLTDGYGGEVKPEKPERWYWFLSEQSDSYHDVPKAFNIFKL